MNGGGLSLQRRGETIVLILDQVVAELRSSHPDTTINTMFNLTQTVNCDGQRIGQLFSNLLGNAVTHGPPDQPIGVRATAQNGIFELSVSNSVDPIPPAAMAQLFRGAVKHSLQGLRLGLYSASEIARAHGVTLDVIRRQTVTFRMPTPQEIVS